MKQYSLTKTEIPMYQYLVFSKSYLSPSEFLNQIEGELSNKDYSGKVAFDYLLSNGNNDNRFISAYFDGKHFDRKSFTVLNSEEKRIVNRFSQHYYKKNSNIVDRSILSSPLRFTIKKGL